MVDDTQRQKVVALVKDARSKGVRVLLGGEAAAGNGIYYPPTVLADVTDAMDVASQEIFGPVATVRTVSSSEEALRIANATPYGLGASVWTSDAAKGEEIASKLQSGMIGVNRGLRGIGDSPWVGARQSGFGFTGGVEGTRQFTQLRTITRTIG
jgi:acyl-CoA reductase-like NAD-dependent aldehyde dehydrogenase